MQRQELSQVARVRGAIPAEWLRVVAVDVLVPSAQTLCQQANCITQRDSCCLAKSLHLRAMDRGIPERASVEGRDGLVPSPLLSTALQMFGNAICVRVHPTMPEHPARPRHGSDILHRRWKTNARQRIQHERGMELFLIKSIGVRPVQQHRHNTTKRSRRLLQSEGNAANSTPSRCACSRCVRSLETNVTCSSPSAPLAIHDA